MQKLMTAAVLMAGLFLFSSLKAQETDSLSYSIGVLLAKNLKSQGFDKIDYASFESAVKDVFADGELMIDPQQAQMTVQTFMMKKQQMKGEKNKEAGEAFLEENAQREEVTVLPSGLQYEVLQEGSGEKPSADSKVKVHYTGKLVDGTVFDSSVERGQPATFGVGQVIKGWTEALQLMPEGAKWKVYIPYDLAYGPQGNRGIEPYSTLIFEVELLEIVE